MTDHDNLDERLARLKIARAELYYAITLTADDDSNVVFRTHSQWALKVFASFVPLLAALGIAGYFGAVLPLGMVIALTALELLVAFLQAYVFTILTCIYINDAIHPGH